MSRQCTFSGWRSLRLVTCSQSFFILHSLVFIPQLLPTRQNQPGIAFGPVSLFPPSVGFRVSPITVVSFVSRHLRHEAVDATTHIVSTIKPRIRNGRLLRITSDFQDQQRTSILSLPLRELNDTCILQVASKRLQTAKSDRFHDNVHRRGKVTSELEKIVSAAS